MAMRKNSFWHYLRYWVFWYCMPSVDVKLKWPVGEIIVTPGQPGWDWALGATQQLVMSADPNDHYRPWLEANVGSQGWAWDWGMVDNDVADNQLTLKVRRDKAEYATIAAMKWT